MKKLIIILFICLSLMACKNNNQRYIERIVCVDNVEYMYVSDSQWKQGSFVPHYKPDGTLYLCK